VLPLDVFFDGFIAYPDEIRGGMFVGFPGEVNENLLARDETVRLKRRYRATADGPDA
jgi:hypothetical protein